MPISVIQSPVTTEFSSDLYPTIDAPVTPAEESVFQNSNVLDDVELEMAFLAQSFDLPWDSIGPRSAVAAGLSLNGEGVPLSKKLRSKIHSDFARRRHRQLKSIMLSIGTLQDACKLLNNEFPTLMELRREQEQLQQQHKEIATQQQPNLRADLQHNLNAQLFDIERKLKRGDRRLEEFQSSVLAKRDLRSAIPERYLRCLRIDTGQGLDLIEPDIPYPPWYSDWLGSVMAGQPVNPPAMFLVKEALVAFLARFSKKFGLYVASWSPNDVEGVMSEFQLNLFYKLIVNAPWFTEEMRFENCSWQQLLFRGWKKLVQNSAYRESTLPNSKHPRPRLPSSATSETSPVVEGIRLQPRGLPQLPVAFDLMDLRTDPDNRAVEDFLNSNKFDLSETEKECLRLLSQGYSIEETAKQLQMPKSIVHKLRTTAFWQIRRASELEWFNQHGLSMAEQQLMHEVLKQVDVPKKAFGRRLVKRLCQALQWPEPLVQSNYDSSWNKLFEERAADSTRPN